MTPAGIRSDTKLKVHVVDAINLPENGQSRVRVQQANAQETTEARVGDGPIWNEAIIFNISDPSQRLIIQLEDINGNVFIRDDIDLNDHRDYKKMGNDVRIKVREDDDESPELRIRLHYSYSDIERYRTMLEEWHIEIEDGLNDYAAVVAFQDNMQ